LTELGITKLEPAAINDSLLPGFVLGCNAPKPARATKVYQTTAASESSFCSSNNIVTARTAGWKVRPGKPFGKATASGLSKTWYVTINNIKYAWQAAQVPTGLVVNINDIGIKEATAANDDLVFGCSFPKPARAKKQLNDNGDTFSSFWDPSVATLPAGWTAANGPKFNRRTINDLRAMI